jgi:GrpB-like predicted nucleotidyltransferase (UPF0157 family)
MENPLHTRMIEVVNYDPKWPKRFAEEKSQLTKVIGNNALKIEHIGSTAVVGLAAKPIIDILIEVVNVECLDAKNDVFTALNYEVKGENGIKGRRYFQKGGNQRSHHIHVYQSGDDNLTRHRAFSNYLAAHVEVADQYSKIKRQSALNCNNDITRYINDKNSFIEVYEKLAVQWYLQIHKSHSKSGFLFRTTN